MAYVREPNQKGGFIDKTGKVVIAPQFDNTTGGFKEGFASVRIGDKRIFIDKTGKQIINQQFDETLWFSNGLVAVKLNGKWGVIDKSGKEVIPFKYERIGLYNEGLMSVRLDRKWGFIDKAGNIIIPLQFVYEEEPLSPPVFASNGRAQVEKDDRYIVIDKTGKEVQ